MDQIKMLEAIAGAAKRLDDRRLADFLAALRTAEEKLADVLRERIDWREFQKATGAELTRQRKAADPTAHRNGGRMGEIPCVGLRGKSRPQTFVLQGFSAVGGVL
jgi:hypothetical protein